MKFQQVTLDLVERIEKEMNFNQKSIWNFVNNMYTIKNNFDKNMEFLTETSFEEEANLFSQKIFIKLERQVEMINLYAQLTSLLSEKDAKKINSKIYKAKCIKILQNDH